MTDLLESTVPFDIETCEQRLKNRHESPRFFAWDWQRRTWVRTRWLDAHTCRFTLKRVEKSNYFGYGSLGVVRGYLRRLDHNQTVVLAEPHIVWLWIIAPSVLFGLALVATQLGANDNTSNNPQSLTIWLVMMSIFAIGGSVFSWWWANQQAQFLIGTVKEALGIWE